jgi:hypothetical protein
MMLVRVAGRYSGGGGIGDNRVAKGSEKEMVIFSGQPHLVKTAIDRANQGVTLNVWWVSQALAGVVQSADIGMQARRSPNGSVWVPQ